MYITHISKNKQFPATRPLSRFTCFLCWASSRKDSSHYQVHFMFIISFNESFSEFYVALIQCPLFYRILLLLRVLYLCFISVTSAFTALLLLLPLLVFHLLLSLSLLRFQSSFSTVLTTTYLFSFLFLLLFSLFYDFS